MSSISDQLKSYSSATGPRSKGFRLGASIDTSRLSQLGCGGRCCKLALMGLSIFLFCAGVGVLAGGAYVGQNLEIGVVIGNDFTNAILAFGVILIFISVLGLAGAMRESRMILACFLLVMGIMMLVLLIFGAWALSNLGKEQVVLARAWQAFSEDEKHSVENAYTCCGAMWWGDTKDPEHTCPTVCQKKNSCGPCFPMMITDFRNLYTAFGVVFILVRRTRRGAAGEAADAAGSAPS